MIGVLTLLVVLRPMVLRITAVAPAALAGGGAALASLTGPTGTALQALQPSGATATGAASTLPLLEDESMVSIAQIEGQMRASSLRRIGALVEKHRRTTSTQDHRSDPDGPARTMSDKLGNLHEAVELLRESIPATVPMCCPRSVRSRGAECWT